MTNKLLKNQQTNVYKADCENCFGLCCVALPYAKSADFAVDKDGGTPCKNLDEHFRCRIHSDLRNKGFKGCTVYECFGAGQQVSQNTFNGQDWRKHPQIAEEMFNVFPKMQQLFEMLYYLQEGLNLEITQPLHNEILKVKGEVEALTELSPNSVLELDIPQHRMKVSIVLEKISSIVRGNEKTQLKKTGNLFGANLKGKKLKGTNFRGSLLIATNLSNADLQNCDFLGADLRDADLSNANLSGSIFLTQAQVNAAIGNKQTKLPQHLNIPQHWLK
ncbi:pentapeptide repeat-containing protein [Lysinibacillus endophyticus]|uniref:pentapeptide repeat-containing protein n=1 Tax=Ureibacillus endophyticus TaxID=1978490 RepID=UPI00209F43FB|nr:pentapeptide repeat-containing protein [Lysinibacillus endophyticus]MCP1144751.1 pentapeptide repeat-containing protein [Lysinibacillus endophyticus]